MILYLNEIMAALAIPVLLLVFRGLFPHMIRQLRREGDQPPQVTLIVLMVLIVDVKSIIRMAYWDLWMPFLRGDPGSLNAALFNGSINALSLVAGLCGLAALYRIIPEDDRTGWSWLTAPFYPRACAIWRRNRS